MASLCGQSIASPAERLSCETQGVSAAGASYEVITDSSGNVVGNFSLTSTPITANANALTLPSTFNATQLLHTGSYTAVITYYPTINFTQPVPLTITFSITVWLSLHLLIEHVLLGMHRSVFCPAVSCRAGNPAQCPPAQAFLGCQHQSKPLPSCASGEMYEVQ